VQVEALPGLLPADPWEAEKLRDGRGRLEARAERLVEDPAHLGRHIETDLVEELEGAHWHPEGPQRLVDAWRRCALVEEPHGLVQVGAEDPVHDEARSVLDPERQLAQFPRDGLAALERLVRGAGPADHLDERHAVDGVEEVEADDPLRPLQPGLELRDGER
jgi:hypothetical protein